MGLKKFETRSWATKYRGPLAIHASVRPLPKADLELARRYGILEMEFGHILAVVDLADCVLIDDEFIKRQSRAELDFGNWRIGWFAWRLENLQVLKSPIPVRGRQGLWSLDDRLLDSADFLTPRSDFIRN